MDDAPPGDRSQARTLVEAQGVSVRFGRRNVLDAVDLTVRAGEIVTLIGLNGAGKSTLIRVILGIVRPDRGEVSRAPGLRVGYSPQHVQRDPIMPMTVRRFLTLGASATARETGSGAGRGRRGTRSSTIPLAEISGGEMQRVLLARALLREPRPPRPRTNRWRAST